MALEIRTVAPGTDLLEGIVELGKRYSRTLGFFPRGAFDERAGSSEILAAIEDGRVVGYAAFRLRRRFSSVSLTHLCVDGSQRSSGIARALVEALRARVTDASGIELWCRKDYEATRAWPKLGFVARAEKPGKGGTLVNWWWRNERAPQLELLSARPSDRELLVAVDASVFFEILALEATDETSDADSIESAALLADWLDPYVELAVTAELLNEISRSDDSERRDRARRFAHDRFSRLPEPFDEYVETERRIKLLLSSPRHDSDRRQLARAASGDANVFVTRDTYLLERAEQLEELLGIQVLSPSELVVRADVLAREHEYRPRRVRGSLYLRRRVSDQDTTSLVRDVLSTGSGETKRSLRQRISACQKSPDDSFLLRVEDESGNVVGLLGATIVADGDVGRFDVSLLRCTAPASKAPTIAQELISHAVQLAVDQSCELVVVSDPHLSADLGQALAGRSFSETATKWSKLASPRVGSAPEIEEYLSTRFERSTGAQLASDVAKEIRTLRAEDPNRLFELERAVWPCKITDAPVPGVVIPIRAHWAAQIFDEDLAGQTLFGAAPHLAFNTENVYYRSASGAVDCPARVLWYVSQDPKLVGTGAIRALSRIEEVVVGPAKEIFRRFSRLGVYEWRDIMAISGNSVSGPVMAIRFSHTETLENPVSFDDCQEVLKATRGRPNQFQSPVRVSSEEFFSLRDRGEP